MCNECNLNALNAFVNPELVDKRGNVYAPYEIPVDDESFKNWFDEYAVHDGRVMFEKWRFDYFSYEHDVGNFNALPIKARLELVEEGFDKFGETKMAAWCNANWLRTWLANRFCYHDENNPREGCKYCDDFDSLNNVRSANKEQIERFSVTDLTSSHPLSKGDTTKRYVKLFRGIRFNPTRAVNATGHLSWSTNKADALWFANRFNNPKRPPVLIIAWIPVEKIIHCINHEDEMIVDTISDDGEFLAYLHNCIELASFVDKAYTYSEESPDNRISSAKSLTYLHEGIQITELLGGMSLKYRE